MSILSYINKITHINTKAMKQKEMNWHWCGIWDPKTNQLAYFLYFNRTWCSPKAQFFFSTINTCPASMSDLGDLDESVPGQFKCWIGSTSSTMDQRRAYRVKRTTRGIKTQTQWTLYSPVSHRCQLLVLENF